MFDLASITEGLGYFKAGVDVARGALGLIKDAKGIVTPEHQEAASKALEMSERQLAQAEALIAKGLGHPLCHCTFPPTPMLTVGWYDRAAIDKHRPVHQCPHCLLTDVGTLPWVKTADIESVKA